MDRLIVAILVGVVVCACGQENIEPKKLLVGTAKVYYENEAQAARNGRVKKVILYDQNLQPVQTDYFNNHSEENTLLRTEKCFYDSSGTIVKKTSWHSENPQSKSVKVFDRFGNIISSTIPDDATGTTQLYIYENEYDDNGKLVKQNSSIFVHDKDRITGGKRSLTTTTYDSTGGASVKHSDPELVTSWRTHNEVGKPIVTASKIHNLERTTYYEYNPSHLLLSKKIYKGIHETLDSTKVLSEQRFTYTSKGLIESQKFYKQGVLDKTIRWDYSDKND